MNQEIKSVTQDLDHRGAQYTTPLDGLSAQQNRLQEERKVPAEPHRQEQGHAAEGM